MSNKIFKSVEHSEEYLKPNCTLFQHIERKINERCHQDPDWICMIDASTGKKILGKDVIPHAKNVASGLYKLGIRMGDIVCLMTENRCDVYIGILATLASGATLATLVPYQAQDETEQLLELVKPRLILCCDSSEAILHSLQKAGKFCDVLIYSFDNSTIYPTFENLMKDDGKAYVGHVGVDLKSHPIFLLPSSGTTGIPKIIQHSNFSFVATCLNMDDRFHVMRNETCVLLCCFYHFSGIFFSTSLIPRSTLVIFSRVPVEAADILKAIEKYKAVSGFMFPFQMVMLSEFQERSKYDTSSLKHLFTGGSKLLVNDQQRLKQAFPDVSFTEIYATTETMFLTNQRSSFNRSIDKGSVGTLELFVEAKVVDYETGECLGANEKGELCFRTPCMMLGYKDAPKSTMEVIDADAFYHTGDIGRIDDNCEVFVEDRIKNFIKFQTKETSIVTLYSTVIENIILGHPAVADTGVCSASHSEFQEVPRAYVKLKENSKATVEDILNYCNSRLDFMHQIRGGMKFVQDIPRNRNGKILRNKLKDL